MRKSRVFVGALVTLAAILILAGDHYFGRGTLIAAAVSLLAFFAAIELCWILRSAGLASYTRLTAFGSLVLSIVPTAFYVYGWRTSPFAAAAGIIFGFIVLAFIIALVKGEPSSGAKAVISGTFVIVYVGFALSFLPRLRELPNAGEQMLYLVLGCAKVGDMAAYFVGRKFGRRRLAPRLSPQKTVEGAIASTVASLVWAAALWPFTKGAVNLGVWLAIALLISLAAQFGDLAESLVKRAAAVKDSSVTLGKIGGMLDVIDSLLLSAPVAYILALMAGLGAR